MAEQSRERQEKQIVGLIAHLYDAATDNTLWPGTAQRIAQTLGSTSAVLKLQTDDASVHLLECTSNLVLPDHESAWADEWHRRDLWVQRSVAFGMGRIVSSDDLVSKFEQSRSPFYQEWLRRLEIHHMMGAVFPAADGAIGVLGIHRPRAAGAYSATERRRAALVLPHLQRALRLRQRLAGQLAPARAAVEALDHIDAGVLVLDTNCRVLHANAAARGMLSDNTELAVISGCIRLRSPSLQQRFLSLVRAAIEVAEGRRAQAASALTVPQRDRLSLALEILPLRPSACPFGSQDPACVIFVRDPQAPVAVDPLRQLFGLTHMEGVVAAALVRGHSLEEMAASLAISIETVRTHLKRVMAKTGTRRQAQVVALMVRSLSAHRLAR